jgi:hypothetical protein
MGSTWKDWEPSLIFRAYPGLSEYLPISQAIGFAVPADAPAEAKAVLVDAFNKAMATDKVKTWAKENYYLLSGKTGADSKAVFRCPGIQFCLDPLGTGCRHGRPGHAGYSQTVADR